MGLGLVVGVGVALALGLWVFSSQMDNMGKAAGGGSPTAIIDTVAVKTDLLSMGGAMKQQFALEGKYISLEELRARGVPIPTRRGAFEYTAEVTDQTFLIKATYIAPDGTKPQPPLTIGPDMLVK